MINLSPHRNFLSLLISVSFLLIQASSLKSWSQEEARPKIGLVLSGGGAKGLAHIGVLKVIEEAGVKIDYIGGTSMGAIIGGLYASGYNASQLDSIFRTADYNAIIQDYTPRTSKNFYEKVNDERYAVTLPFKNFRVGIPTALSKGIYNYNLINRLMYNVRHIRDFNELPIPFLCIATDIETGEQVVLDKGYLAQAVLASGAFPSLYSPVEIDGRYLIDGGIVNNYPIAEIKKLGTDIIIGVDVQDDLKTRESLQEATRILVQISNLQMVSRMRKNRGLTDIYIKPDIEDFSVISFDQGARIIKNGLDAGFSVYEELIKLGSNHSIPLIKPMAVETDSLYIKEIRIPEMENFTRTYITGKLGFKNQTKISFGDLQRGIENLNATNNFSTITYKLNKEGEDDTLVLHLQENNLRSFLRFGIHYDGLFKSAILTNFTRKRVLFKNDVLSTDIILGDNFRYAIDYYVDNGFYWSFGLRSKLTQFNRNVGTDFNEGEFLDLFGLSNININYTEFSQQAYAQTLFIQKFMVGAGVEFKHLKIKSKTLTNINPVFDDSDYLSLFGYMKYDSYDNRYFPKKGWLFNGDIQSFLYSSDFSKQFNRFSIVKGELGFATSFYNNKLTIKLDSEAGVSIADQTVPFFNFVLGGYGFHSVNNFRPFYGYDFLSLDGNSYIKGTALIDYEIFRKHHINFAANYANIGNRIFETTNWFTRISHSGYSLGYGIETFIGPVEIKHSWSPETKNHFTWFSVGFWF